jgi:hypothetical protein
MARTRVIGLVIVAVLVGAAAFAITTLTYLAPIDSFMRSPDGRTLVASARLGTGDAVLWHVAREDEQTVTLLVWVRRTPRPVNDLVATHVSLTFELNEALRQRTIVAPDGRPVPEQP